MIDVKASLIGSLSKANDNASIAATVNESCLVQLQQGTGNGNADLIFSDDRQLAASATENLDLAGVLSDVFGNTLTAAKVKAILIEADAGNTNNVVVFGAASNPFNGPLSGTTPKITLEPGCAVLLTSKVGWAVTPATGDIILVANSGAGTPVNYKITIVAATA